jgi:hypothetical protein
MILVIVYDFIKVLLNQRKHPTNDEYFPKYILFSTIYLL